MRNARTVCPAMPMPTRSQAIRLLGAAALCATIAPVDAQTTPPSQAGPATNEPSVRRAPPPNWSASMEDLKGAAQELRESIQAVAQTKPGPDRDRALRQAHDALLETQQAMVALPPQLRTEDPRYAAAQDKAMDRLKQAAERLRESVQAMAQQPPGDGRNRAMQQARSALWDTQQAMVAVFDPHPARGDAKGGQAPAADKARGS